MSEYGIVWLIVLNVNDWVVQLWNEWIMKMNEPTYVTMCHCVSMWLCRMIMIDDSMLLLIVMIMKIEFELKKNCRRCPRASRD